MQTLADFPPEKIRNFACIAHVDHGKSVSLSLTRASTSADVPGPCAGTLCDRMLEMTGTIPPAAISRDQPEQEAKNEQVLDTLKVERERGITVRSPLTPSPCIPR